MLVNTDGYFNHKYVFSINCDDLAQIDLTNENHVYINLSAEKAILFNAMDFGTLINRFNIIAIHALLIDRTKELFSKEKLELK